MKILVKLVDAGRGVLGCPVGNAFIDRPKGKGDSTMTPTTLKRLFTALALVTLLSACGGGDGPTATAHPLADAAATVTPGGSLTGTDSRQRALAVQGSIDASMLFDWAERTYPELFPKGPANQQLTAGGVTYTLRYYPMFDNYLGVATDGNVYALGRFTANVIKGFGKISDYTCDVAPNLCVDSQPPPGGLYLGYYAEDVGDNPEDPTMGAFTMNLPPGEGAYAGSMFFTYVGCQNNNVGTVSGTKAGQAISGTWTGTLDGLPQSGGYSAQYSETSRSYAGSYTVAAGKQFRNLLPCIQYYIASKGVIEMFPTGTSTPNTFAVSLSGRRIQWGSAASGVIALVYVLDPAVAQTTSNPVLWQTLIAAQSLNLTIPADVVLQAGREYLAVVSVADAINQRVAFGSQRFVAP